ncbi:hypothetical protein [Fodinibius sediminis]|uniref:CDP-Glycerol:Poly(Glycerophosphate) glycerophosphotransferase n=1 Tax=Fodinibius sediminis TaxID=1214077 RepID=A0A521EUQ4_9BACT|nr:hypothetical protein [Fodinibius sediminis]SMO87639.1 hypothetical protein SAMN06265218_11924 [Fodinibius sediminis]
MNFIGIIKKAIHLNLDELNYAKNNFLGYKHIDADIIPVILFLIKETFYRIWLDSKAIFISNSSKGKHICFYGTKNQYNAIYPIVSNINNAEFCSIKDNKNLHLHTALGYVLSWFFFPFLLNKYVKKSKVEEKTSIACFIRSNFTVYGLFIWYSIYFSYIKPKSIIVANDHHFHFRLLKEVCKYIGIPICYIQHASVTKNFPKLDFDLSFLEGRDAYDKYSKKGIDSEVHLIGMPKFDRYSGQINNNIQLKSLGVAFNLLDDIERIKKFLNSIIKETNNIEITLRPHPRDDRINFFKKICDENNIRFSDAGEVNSFEFLGMVDAIISSESSIHLEAALMNVYPIYYRFSDEITDYYGYIENELVTDVFENHDPLIKFLDQLKIKRPTNIRERCKYYNSTIGTKHDGKSGKLIKKIFEGKKFNIN